jgi:hypothetical protein
MIQILKDNLLTLAASSFLSSIGCDNFLWRKGPIFFSFSLYSSIGPSSLVICPKDWHVLKNGFNSCPKIVWYAP